VGLAGCDAHGFLDHAGLLGDDVSAVEGVVCGLLVLLDQIAASAADDLQAVNWEVTLEVVLLAHIGALHGLQDPVGAAKVQADAEANARGVNGGVALESWGFAETVVRLSEGDARAAAGDEAGIDGIEAAEEVRVPWLSSLSRSCWLGDVIRLVHGVLRTLNPIIDIVAMNGRLLSRLLLNWGRSGHYED